MLQISQSSTVSDLLLISISLWSSHRDNANYLKFNVCCSQIKLSLPIQPFSRQKSVANMDLFFCSSSPDSTVKFWSDSIVLSVFMARNSIVKCYFLRTTPLLTNKKQTTYRHVEDLLLLKIFTFFLAFWKLIWRAFAYFSEKTDIFQSNQSWKVVKTDTVQFSDIVYVFEYVSVSKPFLFPDRQGWTIFLRKSHILHLGSLVWV